jgi:hypothetical protein
VDLWRVRVVCTDKTHGQHRYDEPVAIDDARYPLHSTYSGVMETQRTTAPSSEDQALRDWQAATAKMSEAAQKVQVNKVDEATFEDLRTLRAAEREAWQRCRPHWAD